jgi:eukaryotic-like serine/threonine-protein kinase
MALVAGTRLGPYEIISPLGAGGMGEVYRATDTRLDRTVAIKVLNSSLDATPDLKARFEREARTISQLNHPNICTLHDVGHDNGTDFLVMEFIEGESLSARLKNGPVPADQLLKIAIEVADALDKAHRAGIVHRDLKPGNVMLTKTGAKLLDFGLAKPLTAAAGASGIGSGSSASVLSGAMTMTSPASPLTSAGSIVGTVQYMSPEQIHGAEADARGDIFAFGVLLFEMATGKHAFAGKTQSAVVGSILAVEPPPVSSLQPSAPPALDRIVRICLEKDPNDRYQCAHDLMLSLQAIAEAPAPATLEAAPPARSSRSPWITAALATALLIAIAAAGYFASLALQPKPVVHAYILPPGKAQFSTGAGAGAGAPAVSPDGSKLAFVARNEQGKAMLYVQPLSSPTAQPLAGTEDAAHPFWSPDSRSLGFFAGNLLKEDRSRRRSGADCVHGRLHQRAWRRLERGRHDSFRLRQHRVSALARFRCGRNPGSRAQVRVWGERPPLAPVPARR